MYIPFLLEQKTRSPRERASLIEDILDSVDRKQAKERHEIEKAWAQESELRLAAYRKGLIKAVSAENAFADLNKRRKKMKVRVLIPALRDFF